MNHLKIFDMFVNENNENNDDDYAGYSENGITQDKNAETELVNYLNIQSKLLDETANNYFKNGKNEQGIKMLNDLRTETDNHLTQNMKSAKNFNSIYHDIFYKKYIEYKTIK